MPEVLLPNYLPHCFWVHGGKVHIGEEDGAPVYYVVTRKQDRQDGSEVPKPPQGPASSDLTSSHRLLGALPPQWGQRLGTKPSTEGLWEPLQIQTIAHAVQEAWPAAVSACSRLIGIQGTVKESVPPPTLTPCPGLSVWWPLTHCHTGSVWIFVTDMLGWTRTSALWALETLSEVWLLSGENVKQSSIPCLKVPDIWLWVFKPFPYR